MQRDMPTGERSWRKIQEAGSLRRHARYPVSLWAVENADGGSYFHHVQDLSVGGFFLRKPMPLPVGAAMEVVLELPTGRRIQAKARVVHTVVSPARSGNGVELESLSNEDQTALQEFLGEGDAWFN